MVKSLRIILVLVFASSIFISCGDLNKRVDEKLDNLMKKAESIDSLLTEEADKALRLDSLINTGSEKAKKLDSILDKTTSRMDSLVKEKINPNK